MLFRSLDIRGIYFSSEYKRFYPNKSLASHILGFCNIDSRGAEGIEKGLDSYLLADVIQNDGEKRQDDYGYNIQLTIDSVIQAAAEIKLREAVEFEKASSASLILLDGLTGEILSMANYPDFNPNQYEKYGQKYFRNTAIFNQFEPGSVFKIFSIASLLDSGVIDIDSRFFCDGLYSDEHFDINCTGNHGFVDVPGIFKFSCNDGTLQAVSSIPDYDFYHYMKSFGFGEKTDILLPGEQPGILRDYENWSIRSMLSVPIGQEISVNSLQMVQAATVFLNDGKMIKPYLVKKIFDRKNNTIKEYSRQEIREVVKPGISGLILKAMTASTTEGGTVSTLEIPGISFAAKSGTAEIYDSSIGAYSEDMFTSSLLAIFPYESPRYIVYAVFHKPSGEVKWGGEIGARLINNFLSALTGYLEIYPEDYLIQESNIAVNREYEKVISLPAYMPDLTGLAAGDVPGIFSDIKLQVKVFGQGKVYRQNPAPGKILNTGSTIEIYLQ